MKVLVFKTNIKFKRQVHALQPHIDTMHDINRWNVDLDDVDKILRIETRDLSPRIVEDTLLQAGYFCQELDD